MPPRSEPAGAAGGRAQHGESGKGASANSGGGTGGAARSCPICGKPAQQATHPFCSKRCRDVDLNRWLSGSYIVPGAENEHEGSE